MSVDDVATRPDQYKRQIAVRGVVSFVSTKDRVAVLISESEFATCGTSCPNVALPVRWRGELPAITDRVIVQGEIEKTEQGYLFNAENTEIVERAALHRAAMISCLGAWGPLRGNQCTWRSSSCQYFARSSFLSGLPSAVTGMASAKSSDFGA